MDKLLVAGLLQVKILRQVAPFEIQLQIAEVL